MLDQRDNDGSGTDHRCAGVSEEEPDLDSPEYQYINRILTRSCEDAGGIIEDLISIGALLVVLSLHRSLDRPAASPAVP